MKGKPYHRRQLLIGRFQYQLLGFNLLYFFVVIFFIGIIIYLPLIVQINNTDLPISQRVVVAEEFLSFHFRLGPPTLIVFFLLFLHAVIVSHRIAGPLYRFKKIYKAICEGDLTCHIILRKGDYLEEEAELINRMVFYTREKLIEIQGGIQAAEKDLEKLEGNFPLGPNHETLHALGNLKIKMEGIGQQIKFFRLKKDNKDLKIVITEDLPCDPTSLEGQKTPSGLEKAG